jgi:hypothetical protein
MMRLPGCQQRALDRIEQALVAEDPGLGFRFAFFARLTRYEAIPLTEQVPGRLQRVLRRVIVFPLLGISLAAVLAACGLDTQPAGMPRRLERCRERRCRRSAMPRTASPALRSSLTRCPCADRHRELRMAVPDRTLGAGARGKEADQHVRGADIREWHGHDVTDPYGTRSGNSRLSTSTPAPTASCRGVTNRRSLPVRPDLPAGRRRGAAASPPSAVRADWRTRDCLLPPSLLAESACAAAARPPADATTYRGVTHGIGL